MKEYHIHVCKNTGKYFDAEIKNRKLDEKGVHVVSENLSDKIVIPIHNDWYEIEGQLFTWKQKCDIKEVKEAGFWGQFGTCAQ